jgi:magnesium chelatase subunit I
MKLTEKKESNKMNYQKIKTLGELKKANYVQKGIKDELRENLIYNIQNKINVFEA